MKLCHRRKCWNLAENGRRFCKVCRQKDVDSRLKRMQARKISSGAVIYEEE